jgi:hypothetical protein
MDDGRIPRVAHFVFGMRPQEEPFHLVHYLAIASCQAVLEPDEIRVHYHDLPYGFYWDLARPLVTLHRVDPPTHAGRLGSTDDYAYAHQTDLVRLDVLAEHGGLYADIDTLFVSAPRDELWNESCVVGSPALLMAAPGTPFIDQWRERLATTSNGWWPSHRDYPTSDLDAAHPAAVHVEPPPTFDPFPATRDGLHRLLVERVQLPDGAASMHLSAHLWWDVDQRDHVADVHAHMIDEAWIRSQSTTYARAAAPFLPEHDSF